MTETTNVLAFRQPSAVDDPLTDIVRAGARDLLARAIEIEVGAFLASTANLTLPDGRARLVRHGHGPVREIATGIGPVEVARPKVRDRGASGPGDRLRFSSAILPLWARRTKSLDALTRSSICAASRPATSRRRSRRCSARMRRTCRLR
ncbi:hypothetical protein ABIF66_011814 [Bradyrhizobium japonicum]|nr:hypothetical protein [Bradyrhizobium japonicum]